MIIYDEVRDEIKLMEENLLKKGIIAATQQISWAYDPENVMVTIRFFHTGQYE